MMCSQCVAEGKRSSIREGLGTRTLVYCAPFYDEDGKYHIHDMNMNYKAYSCSNGHTWNAVKERSSCWCGWENA